MCYGQSEIPLADEYENELIDIYNTIQTIEFSGFFSSPSGRCLRLSSGLYKMMKDSNITLQKPVLDARLMELDFGNWELQTWDEIKGPEVAAWMEDWVHQPAGGGESLLQLVDRVNSFILDIKNGYFGKFENILITTHSGVIRCFYHILKTISWSLVPEL